MSQLDYLIRALVSDRQALRDAVGVCDDFQPSKHKNSLKQHLQNATKESKPQLGNPAHPTLQLDECEQLIIPLYSSEHPAVAVVKFEVSDKQRQAIIQYFADSQADLNEEHLVSLVAFFTENGYEVEYQCISENLHKPSIDPLTLISYQAIDLVNHNANQAENLVEKLGSEANSQESTVLQTLPNKKAYRWPLWILAAMLMSMPLYALWDDIHVYQWMGMLPANPLLAIVACAGFFCGALLMVEGLKYLMRPISEKPTLASVTKNCLGAAPQDTLVHKSLLHAYPQSRQGIVNEGAKEEQFKKKKRPQW